MFSVWIYQEKHSVVRTRHNIICQRRFGCNVSKEALIFCRFSLFYLRHILFFYFRSLSFYSASAPFTRMKIAASLRVTAVQNQRKAEATLRCLPAFLWSLLLLIHWDVFRPLCVHDFGEEPPSATNKHTHIGAVRDPSKLATSVWMRLINFKPVLIYPACVLSCS